MTTKLSPTQDLMLSYLVARGRLGVEKDVFEPSLLRSAEILQQTGYLHIVKDSDPLGNVLVELTDEGRAYAGSPTWTPPRIAELEERISELETENIALLALARKAI